MSASTASSCTPLPADETGIAEIGIIGIGNTLMGDDGAGIEVAEKLKARLAHPKKVFIHLLQQDLFEMADLLGHARKFIFVDVFLGTPVGSVKCFESWSESLMPSLHQTDIGSIMHMLEPLGLVNPFPEWEIWGIAVEPPFFLGNGLSQPVAQAVDRLVSELCSTAGM